MRTAFNSSLVENYTLLQMQKPSKSDFHGLKNADVWLSFPQSSFRAEESREASWAWRVGEYGYHNTNPDKPLLTDALLPDIPSL